MRTFASITVPAQIDSLSPVMDFVDTFADKSGFGKKRTGEVRLAIEEILVNIIHYAYPEISGEVEIACHLADDGTMVIEVKDQGIPFNILSVKDPNIAAGVDERQIGGLGIFFVKQLMDDVQYRREGDQNILTLSVYPRPESSGP